MAHSLPSLWPWTWQFENTKLLSSVFVSPPHHERPLKGGPFQKNMSIFQLSFITGYVSVQGGKILPG